MIYLKNLIDKDNIMYSLNLNIDEALYNQAREISLIEKKSISQIIRESLSHYINSNKSLKNSSPILENDDEKEILSILENDNFTSSDDFKKKFNL